MIKYFVIIFFALNTLAQEYKLTIDEKHNEPMLVGTIEREALTDSNFSYWFDIEYEEYQVDTTALNEIDESLKSKKIIMVMGTWCSDSQREVPRFYKILDQVGYSSLNMKVIAVDRGKKDLSGEVVDLNIELVPTFIIYSDGKEIGRIIESSEISLEKDLQKILK